MTEALISSDTNLMQDLQEFNTKLDLQMRSGSALE